MMEEIETGLVDVIAVYHSDRLVAETKSRSCSAAARIGAPARPEH
jgi:hypothetical protein